MKSSVFILFSFLFFALFLREDDDDDDEDFHRKRAQTYPHLGRDIMANTSKEPSKEDIEWFRSTFRPIPKPKLPDDCVEYSLYVLPSNSSDASAKPLEVRSRLREVQKASSELTKGLLKDYIWQRENFGLELTSEDGRQSHWRFIAHHSKKKIY